MTEDRIGFRARAVEPNRLRDRSGGISAAAGDGVVALPDGRSITYRSFGSADGTPLIALHGTPGSRLKFTVAHQIALHLGVRIIAPDRWGYGGTSVHARPSFKSYAADIGFLADDLKLDRFALIGVSGGGPYAAALASEMPARVTALALVAPVGPIAGEPGLDISAFHRWCFGPLTRSPATISTVFQAFRSVLGTSPEIGMRLAMIRVSPADRAVLRQTEVARRLGETFVEGLRPGVAGPVIDLGLFGAPWDIDLRRADVPARLWLGTNDQNVPQGAARLLASRLPRCMLTVLEDEGHLWIANNYDTVISWLAEASRRTS